MPYRPILNPVYYHWEPWPHVYRRGGWISNVTGRQAPPSPVRTVVPSGLQGLGEVPWQCWDQPGFKECQAACFSKAQATDLSAEAKSALVDQCFNTNCVDPCRAKIPATTNAAADDTTKTVDQWLAKATPMNIAIVALVIAVGATLLTSPKKIKRGSR